MQTRRQSTALSHSCLVMETRRQSTALSQFCLVSPPCRLEDKVQLWVSSVCLAMGTRRQSTALSQCSQDRTLGQGYVKLCPTDVRPRIPLPLHLSFLSILFPLNVSHLLLSLIRQCLTLNKKKIEGGRGDKGWDCLKSGQPCIYGKLEWFFPWIEESSKVRLVWAVKFCHSFAGFCIFRKGSGDPCAIEDPVVTALASKKGKSPAQVSRPLVQLL